MLMMHVCEDKSRYFFVYFYIFYFTKDKLTITSGFAALFVYSYMLKDIRMCTRSRTHIRSHVGQKNLRTSHANKLYQQLYLICCLLMLIIAVKMIIVAMMMIAAPISVLK